jgi:hypothetical protein
MWHQLTRMGGGVVVRAHFRGWSNVSWIFLMLSWISPMCRGFLQCVVDFSSVSWILLMFRGFY